MYYCLAFISVQGLSPSPKALSPPKRTFKHSAFLEVVVCSSRKLSRDHILLASLISRAFYLSYGFPFQLNKP